LSPAQNSPVCSFFVSWPSVNNTRVINSLLLVSRTSKGEKQNEVQ
jgi:hypothetical protein